MGLTSERIERSSIEGTFSLILYSGSFADGVGRVAFLDREEDRSIIKPYAPEFEYTVIPHLNGREAVERAEQFISQHHAFLSSHTTAIISESGIPAGYEIRPYYDPLVFGQQDILDITYIEKDSLITARIRLMPSVERILTG